MFFLLLLKLNHKKFDMNFKICFLTLISLVHKLVDSMETVVSDDTTSKHSLN